MISRKEYKKGIKQKQKQKQEIKEKLTVYKKIEHKNKNLKIIN